MPFPVDVGNGLFFGMVCPAAAEVGESGRHMSGIVAIFNRDRRPVDPAEWEAMLQARVERGPDGSRVQGAGEIAVAHQLFRLLPEELGEEQPLLMEDLILSADARLDNRAELARALDLDVVRIATTSDAHLILLAYRRWGLRCPEHLLGDFAFVLWDTARRRLFAARDALGARDACYYVDGTLGLVASEVAHILAHPAIRARINDNRVAAFLAGVWDRPEETFFRDIHYLPPAHALCVTTDGVDFWRYSEILPASVRYPDERQYAERYRELLTEAVRCRLRVAGTIGISLSGGLDSTSLAALAAPLLPAATGQARLKSFSYTFDELDSCDEREYIRPVVERYDLEASWVPADNLWTFKDLARWPVARDYIISDVYAWLPAAVREAAAGSGVRALLAGYFGDTLMSGGHYWALDMAREGKFGLLARTARANWGAFARRDSFFDFGLRRLIPPGVAKFYRRIRPRRAAAVAPGIHGDLLSRTDLAGRLSPAPAPGRTPPGYRQRYDSLTGSNFSQSVIIRHQYNRCGMELLEPYYDRRLVEFVLAVPAYVLGRPGSYRRLHRAAMEGLLPDPVRLRAQRTTFAPLLRKGLAREGEAIRRLMARPLVVEREYINADWLEAQLESDYEPSASWSLLLRTIFLELWLQRYWA